MLPAWTMAFLMGACGLYYLTYLPSLSLSIFIFALALLCFYFAILFRSWIACLISALSLGFIWLVIHAYLQLSLQLPAKWEGKPLLAKGWIVTIPEQHTNHWRLTMELHEIEQQLLKIPLRVQLHWYPVSPIKLAIGDKWQLELRLKRPYTTYNPGGVDREAQWMAQGIKAIGYVRTKGCHVYLGNSIYKAPIDHFRQILNQRIKNALQDSLYTGLIAALAVGIVADVTPTQWSVLRNTNTNHLMAISGLHIGLVAGVALLIISLLWRRIPRFALILPAPQAAAIASLIAALFYSALAGFSIPTQRALIMLSVFLLVQLLQRYLSSGRAWFIALLSTLIYNPLAILSRSFWLSYAAVGVLLYGTTCRIQHKGVWWKWGRAQWVVGLGLMPLLLIFFQQVSLAGFFANSVAIPWVSFVVIPLSLLGSLALFIHPSLAQWILSIAAQCLAGLWKYLSYLAAIPQLQWRCHIDHSWLFFTFCIAIIIALAPRGWPGRWLSFIWALPLILYKPISPRYSEMRFTLLDVGQGLSAVVQTQYHTLVYDTGAKLSANLDMGQAAVLPYLSTLAISKLDALIISHTDNDHSGGVASVLASIPVQNIYTSSPDYFAQYHPMHCLVGQAWIWDGVHFEFLHPPANFNQSGNNRSCVLHISIPGHSVLLTGDIEGKAEKYLLQTQHEHLPSDILVAPHHGSRTSSTLAFIQRVFPDYVLFAVGYGNRYHHPHPKVVARYKTIGARTYASPHCGAILFDLKPNQPLSPPDCYRQTHRHVWNDELN